MKVLALFLSLSALSAQSRLTVCSSGCDHTGVQAAMNAAATTQATTCAPIIIDIAEGTYEAELAAPAKTCARDIILRGPQAYSVTPGRRVTNTGTWAVLRARAGFESAPVIRFTSTVGWRLEGLELEARSSASLIYSIVEIGELSGDFANLATMPSRITIDRCWINGQPAINGPVRGVIISAGRGIRILNSYIEQVKADVDSQAIACLGCFDVEVSNNYLESAGMGFMTGGSSAIGQSSLPPGVAQRNIRVVGNRLAKRPEWHIIRQPGVPTGACSPNTWREDTAASQNYLCIGGTWTAVANPLPPSFTIKNGWEAKDGQGLLVSGNVIGPVPIGAQQGACFLINNSGGLTRNYDVTDVRIVGNQCLDAASGFVMGNLNYLAPFGTSMSRRVTVEHNQFRLGTPWLWPANQRTVTRGVAVIESDSTRIRRNTFLIAAGGYTHAMIASGDWRSFPVLEGHNELAGNIIHTADWLGATYGSLFGSMRLASGVTPCAFASTLPRAGSIWSETANVITGPFSTDVCVTEGPATGFYASGLAGRTANIADVVDVGTFAALPGGVAAGTAGNGENVGAHQPWVYQLSNNSDGGIPNTWGDVGVRSATLSGSTATVRYAMPSAASTCTAAVSSAEVFSAIGSASQATVGRIATATITGASGARFVRLTCDGVTLPAIRL